MNPSGQSDRPGSLKQKSLEAKEQHEEIATADIMAMQSVNNLFRVS
jgi:hypothetical protein